MLSVCVCARARVCGIESRIAIPSAGLTPQDVNAGAVLAKPLQESWGECMYPLRTITQAQPCTPHARLAPPRTSVWD